MKLVYYLFQLINTQVKFLYQSDQGTHVRFTLLKKEKQNLIYKWYPQQLQLNQKYTVEPRYNEPVFWPFVIPRFHFMRAKPQFVVPTERSPLLVSTFAPHVRS